MPKTIGATTKAIRITRKAWAAGSRRSVSVAGIGTGRSTAATLMKLLLVDLGAVRAPSGAWRRPRPRSYLRRELDLLDRQPRQPVGPVREVQRMRGQMAR